MNFYSTKKGFTLIEIMVSLALFIIVAVIALGAFLKIISENKQSQSLQTAMNNANFALESMTRELRVGDRYDCFDASYPATIAINASFLANPNAAHKTTTCFLGDYSSPGIAFYSSIPVNPNDSSCTGTGQTNLIHTYILNGNVLEKAEQQFCSDVLGGSGNIPFAPVTSPDLKITSLGVEVDSASVSNQPKIFLLINGYAGTGPNAVDTSSFVVQTTASQRLMNN